MYRELKSADKFMSITSFGTSFKKATSVIAIAILFAASFAANSHAQSTVKKLTQQNVRSFIEHTSKIMKPTGGGTEILKAQNYLKKHLNDSVRFTSTITYHIPGMPSQDIAMKFDKKDFIKTLSQGAEAIEGYNQRVEILDIKISWGSKQAVIKSKNYETGFMAIPDGRNNNELVPIEGVSTCAQIVELNKKGVIQLHNAVCKTDIHFKES